MAGLSDVSNYLVNLIAGICYPSGASQPSIVSGPVKIYAGWPLPDALDADLPIGVSHISIWPLPGDKPTTVTMGDSEWQEQSNNGAVGASILEVRRQTRKYQITVWANTPTVRDAVADIIDPQLSINNRFILPDGSQAMMVYVNSSQIDSFQKQGIYRRDLFFNVNYATTQITPVTYAIQHTAANLTMSQSGVAGPTTTLNN
ncbi:hypothetical protein ACO0K2_17780 [Undibacterium sp. MH2W]|uniref:hypothetical protein n=1 Tax=Undibacterium sp. MH2W TaxID=3413044 RepID=UPI003BEF6CB9